MSANNVSATIPQLGGIIVVTCPRCGKEHESDPIFGVDMCGNCILHKWDLEDAFRKTHCSQCGKYITTGDRYCSSTCSDIAHNPYSLPDSIVSVLEEQYVEKHWND